MIVIKDISDTIVEKNPFTDETVEVFQGKQIGENAFVCFHSVGQYWAWQLFEFDTPIIDGVSAPKSGKSRVVNPDGFVYGDDIVRIEVSPI